MEKKYSKEEELFNQVKKLLGLKRTEFIFDPDREDSLCEYSDKDGITRCYLRDILESIHEGVHAYFFERNRRLLGELGTIKYNSRKENIEPDIYLEEITARIVEINFQNITLGICTENTIKYMNSTNKIMHENTQVGKKIYRLFLSIYGYECVCPKDIKFYDNIKKDIDPIIIYNKLAKYVGTNELI